MTGVGEGWPWSNDLKVGRLPRLELGQLVLLTAAGRFTGSLKSDLRGLLSR